MRFELWWSAAAGDHGYRTVFCAVSRRTRPSTRPTLRKASSSSYATCPPDTNRSYIEEGGPGTGAPRALLVSAASGETQTSEFRVAGQFESTQYRISYSRTALEGLRTCREISATL